MNMQVPLPEVEEIDDPSEDAFARAFTAQTRQRRRYDVNRGRWFDYDGTRWIEDHLGASKYEMRQITKTLGADDPAKYCKNSAVNGALALAASDPAHAVAADIWDSENMLFGTPSGTVDLRTGEIRRAMPDDYITKLAGCAPEKGDPKRWLQFLEEATAGDRDLMRFLQQMFGYCLTGLIEEHALFFIYGAGGNGKSVFLNLLIRVLGDYAKTAAMTSFVSTRNEQHPTDMAGLVGARLVTASETEEGKKWAENKIKQLTGGDPITARFMHKDFFTYTPNFKLIIVGNHAPALDNVDDAMRRRMNIIPFTHKPVTPDRKLEEKLWAEAGQILNWAIQGCLDWQANGLLRPEAVKAATGEYFAQQDLFTTWVEERCERDGTYLETPMALFRDWSEFARGEGEEPKSLKWLSGSLRRAGIMPRKTGGIRFYAGLRLRNPISGAG